MKNTIYIISIYIDNFNMKVYVYEYKINPNLFST